MADISPAVCTTVVIQFLSTANYKVNAEKAVEDAWVEYCSYL